MIAVDSVVIVWLEDVACCSEVLEYECVDGVFAEGAENSGVASFGSKLLEYAAEYGERHGIISLFFKYFDDFGVTHEVLAPEGTVPGG